MILIKEQEALKAVGKTSMFIAFNYKQEIVEMLKTLGAFWHKDTKLWELPAGNLSEFINKCTFIDNIQIELLKADKKHVSLTQSYKTALMPHQKIGVEWLLKHQNSILADCP